MLKRRDFLRTSGLFMAGAVSLSRSMASAAFAVEKSRPNILFIITDQQFAEAMSCRMGQKYLKTPAIDSIAENGVLFSRAYSPNPLCMPARASLFTGKYPHETTVSKNARCNFDKNKHTCMGIHFFRNGYETAYFGKWHLLYNPKNANEHGFGTIKTFVNNDPEVTRLASSYLIKKHDKPFLLIASFLGPHDICQFSRDSKLPCGSIGPTPSPEQCPPPPENLEVPQKESDTMITTRKGYQYPQGKFPVGDFDADKWRQYRWGYYRIIEKVDNEIGKILKTLKDSGLEERTLIVFVSDHGECAGAHRFNQKTVFYEESSRIPLIFSYKGRTHKKANDTLINMGVDMMPTLFDFAGIKLPEELKGKGQSIKSIVLGRTPSIARDYIVVQNNMVQTQKVMDGIIPRSEGRMVRSDRFKYCLYQYGIQRESLFDLKNDPGETKNLATEPEFRKQLLQHRGFLMEFSQKHNDSLSGELLANNVKAIPFPKASKK